VLADEAVAGGEEERHAEREGSEEQATGSHGGASGQGLERDGGARRAVGHSHITHE
jgi:hypothetical protein